MAPLIMTLLWVLLSCESINYTSNMFWWKPWFNGVHTFIVSNLHGHRDMYLYYKKEQGYKTGVFHCLECLVSLIFALRMHCRHSLYGNCSLIDLCWSINESINQSNPIQSNEMNQYTEHQINENNLSTIEPVTLFMMIGAAIFSIPHSIILI